MSRTTSLCFTKDGFVNPDALSHLERFQTDTAVFFGDGSLEAFDHLCQFDYHPFLKRNVEVAFAKTPHFEMRVVNGEGKLSNPHYLSSETQRIKWICAKICAPFLNINISDITSHSQTQVLLDTKATETVCYLGYYLWSLMLAAEDHLSFPAMAIDRMTKLTYSLTPSTLDLALLQRESGLQHLDYHPATDLLSITVAGEIYSVKLSVLNEFYGKFILPPFREMGGRSVKIDVSISNSTHQTPDSVTMSFAELGRLVEELQSHAYQKIISQTNPMSDTDLLAYAKKVKVNDESCLWPQKNQSIPDFLLDHQDHFTRTDGINQSSESVNHQSSDAIPAYT